MKFSASVFAFLATGAHAFTSSANKAASSSELKYSQYWTPDESAFACGLPGTLAPVGDFDPLGFAKDADEQTMKNYREAGTYNLVWNVAAEERGRPNKSTANLRTPTHI